MNSTDSSEDSWMLNLCIPTQGLETSITWNLSLNFRTKLTISRDNSNELTAITQEILFWKSKDLKLKVRDYKVSFGKKISRSGIYNICWKINGGWVVPVNQKQLKTSIAFKNNLIFSKQKVLICRLFSKPSMPGLLAYLAAKFSKDLKLEPSESKKTNTISPWSISWGMLRISSLLRWKICQGKFNKATAMFDFPQGARFLMFWGRVLPKWEESAPMALCR